MSALLRAISQRRAVKIFEPIAISETQRDQLLGAARSAPSSFHSQPYHLYWVDSPAKRETAAKLCYNQPPARTASAVVVAVADIGCWKETASSQLHWMRESGFVPTKIAEFEKKSKCATLFFCGGPSGHAEVADFSDPESMEGDRNAARLSSGPAQG